MRVRRARALVLGAVVALGAAAALRGQASPEPLSPEGVLDALEFAQFAPIDLTPSGKWIAYTITDPRRVVTDPDPRFHSFNRQGMSIFGLGADVWIADTETGEARNVTGGQGNSHDPVWSPDGRSLVFYSDRGGKANLWLRTPDGKLRRLSDRIVRGIGGQVARWTPDGKQVLFPALPAGMTIEQAADLLGTGAPPVSPASASKGPTVTVFDARKETEKATTLSTAGMVSDLVLVDVADGSSRVLARGRRPAWCQFSPDGRSVAVSGMKDYKAGKFFQAQFDLLVIDLATGTSRALATDIPQEFGGQASWSPDGKWLAYVTGGDSEEGKKGDVYVVSPAGGSPRLVTPGAHPNFSGHEYREPLWDSSDDLYLFHDEELWRVPTRDDGRPAVLARIAGSKILQILAPGGQIGRFWSPDSGKSLTLFAREDATKKVGAYRVDLASGKLSTLFLDERYIDGYAPSLSFDASADGQKIAFVSEDARHAPDIYVAGPAVADAKRLTHLNPQFDRASMGAARLVEWRGLDGDVLRGALLLPAGYAEGKRYPVIVYPYGGSSRSNTIFQFGLSGTGTENMQIFASRGYAVFLPDSKTHVGSPMRDIADGVLSGVAKLVDLGIADPDRLGIMGHSYGGYSTLSLITQTKIFRAAISRAGLADLTGAYGDLLSNGTAMNIQWAEGGQGNMGGPLWEFRSRYIENSPWFYLDRVETPLLIIHGSQDTRVPAHNADEVFVGLRRLGKEVVYARYDGEDHSELYWSYANRLDYLKRVIGWFDEHLKAPAPKGSGR
ncbi:MAG TPA: prolyl oligopeptidase family serine peptidase [Thermoanaerobaculia bacterium]|nr:prolyl oligopeptidase family serine peptidase [Thermoanaerobaculia bacterium]